MCQIVHQQNAELSVDTERRSGLQIVKFDLVFLLRLLQHLLHNRNHLLAYLEGKLIVVFFVFCSVKNRIIFCVPIFRCGGHVFDDLPQCLILVCYRADHLFYQNAGILFDCTVKQRLFRWEIAIT